jgi:hypothetical protein
MPNKPFFNASDDTNFFLTYFTDVGLTNYSFPTWGDQVQYSAQNQPAYFAVGAKVASDDKLLDDPEIVTYSDTGAATSLFSCSSQILEINYTLEWRCHGSGN